MQGWIQDLMTRTFEIPRNEGGDKTLPFKEAIRTFVKPEMTLHIGTGSIMNNAALYEISRCFRGTRPGFTLCILGVVGPAVIPILSGLVKKVITSFCGDSTPAIRPSPIIQRVIREKSTEFEHWTLLTYTQRLLAGAMGLDCIPTRSLIGSSLEKDNSHAFRVIEAPFSPGKQIGMLEALNPDLSLIHGVAADPSGNTIIAPPYGENLYGAMASKQGAVVSVERIVDTDFIRRHAHLVRLPSFQVRSVSEVPLGGHPRGAWTFGVQGVDGYNIDHEFMAEMARVSEDPVQYEAWIREWIWEIAGHDEYVAKLGKERILALKGRSQENSWRFELATHIRDIEGTGNGVSPEEHMIIAGARVIAQKIKQSGYKMALAGLGNSNLAAWLAKYLLQEEGRNVDLIAEVGFFGYLPRPCDPFIFNLANVPSCKMLNDTIEILGGFLSMRQGECLGALSGGQVDRYGNINSSFIPPDTFITGSGGANDVASSALEVVVLILQSPRRYIEGIPYITCPGHRVKTLVSNLGVLRKIDPDGELILTEYFVQPGCDEEGSIRKIKDRCGWHLRVADHPNPLDPPSRKELTILRSFDPDRAFLGSLS